MANVFEQYKPKETKHVIKAMGGIEITLKKLTLKQSQDLANKLVKSVSKEGIPEMDIKAAAGIKLEKISLALVDPKMTVEELESLSSDATEALDEIYAIIDPKTAALIKKEEGKQS